MILRSNVLECLQQTFVMSIGNNVAARGSSTVESVSILLLQKAKVGYNIAQFLAESAILYR